jgi:four helix bundle protein
MDLVEATYKLTESFPRSEDFGLKGQMRRSACSIPSNIAEGTSRVGKKEINVFMRIACGSLRELETQLEISKRVGYVNDESFGRLADELDQISRMLNSLIAAVSRREK